MGYHPGVSSLLWGWVIVAFWAAAVVRLEVEALPEPDDPQHEALAFLQKSISSDVVPSELFRKLNGAHNNMLSRTHIESTHFKVNEASLKNYIMQSRRKGKLGMLKDKTDDTIQVIYDSLLTSAGVIMPYSPAVMHGTAAVAVTNDWCQFVITPVSDEMTTSNHRGGKTSQSTSPSAKSRRLSGQPHTAGGGSDNGVLLEYNDVITKQRKYATARLLTEVNKAVGVNSAVGGNSAMLMTAGKIYSAIPLNYNFWQASKYEGEYQNIKLVVFNTMIVGNLRPNQDTIFLQFNDPDDKPGKTAVQLAESVATKDKIREERRIWNVQHVVISIK